MIGSGLGREVVAFRVLNLKLHRLRPQDAEPARSRPLRRAPLDSQRRAGREIGVKDCSELVERLHPFSFLRSSLQFEAFLPIRAGGASRIGHVGV